MEQFQVHSILFLFFIGYVRAFSWALLLCTLALFAKSFHNFGTPVNALDIAPKHSGSVFGIINAIASTSGLAKHTLHFLKEFVEENSS